MSDISAYADLRIKSVSLLYSFKLQVLHALQTCYHDIRQLPKN